MGTMQHPGLRKRYRGKITLWSEPRYFGFITTTAELPDIGNDIFFHRLNFMAGIPTAQIAVGREVEFEIAAAYKIGRKPQAVRIKLVEPVVVVAGANALQSGVA
jgi:cold shock CspA family protein